MSESREEAVGVDARRASRRPPSPRTLEPAQVCYLRLRQSAGLCTGKLPAIEQTAVILTSQKTSHIVTAT